MIAAFDSKALELAREVQASIDSTEAGPMPSARRLAIIQTAIVAGMHWAAEAASRLQAPAVAEVEDVTPEMISAGWACLRRNHLPRLGPGNGLVEAYHAMRSARLAARAAVRSALRTGGSE